MLLMTEFDSVVWIVMGIADRSGEHFDRRAILKICAALIKEKEFIYLHDTLIKQAGISDFSKYLN